MRIERLVLDQVACFEHLDLTFQLGRDPEKADIHILVGPNGSGKSSILMALAQFFSVQAVGFEKRLRGRDAVAFLMTDSPSQHGITLAPPQERLQLEWENSKLRLGTRSDLWYYSVPEQNPALDRIRFLFDGYNPASPQHSDTRFSFAAFAYSGLRSVASYRLQAITEQRDNPFAQACSFSNAGNPAQLVQWIANTKAKEAFALARGDSARAKHRLDAIVRIEQAISRIIEKKFAFAMEDDPLNVSAVIDGQAVELDVLPDGLKSILSWVADLLMRMDRIPWVDDTPILQRPFVLFLDEIEAHLHPKWQRRVLPTVQTLFPKAQVFISTHSPFVISSADDAWIYPLQQEGKYFRAGEPLPSMVGHSYATVLRDVLGIEAEFALRVEDQLTAFYELRDRALKGNGEALEQLRSKAEDLKPFGEEVLAIVVPELRQVERRLAERAQSGAS